MKTTSIVKTVVLLFCSCLFINGVFAQNARQTGKNHPQSANTNSDRYDNIQPALNGDGSAVVSEPKQKKVPAPAEAKNQASQPSLDRKGIELVNAPAQKGTAKAHGQRRAESKAKSQNSQPSLNNAGTSLVNAQGQRRAESKAKNRHSQPSLNSEGTELVNTPGQKRTSPKD